MSLPFATSQELERETSKLEKQVEAVGENKQDKIIATSEDVGKLVGVDAEGKLALVNAPSGGTKLYEHTAYVKGTYGSDVSTGDYLLSFISNDSRDISEISFTSLSVVGSISIGGANSYICFSKTLSFGPQGNILLSKVFKDNLSESGAFNITSITSDTVTSL